MLYHAASGGSIDVVHLLLSAGADVNAESLSVSTQICFTSERHVMV